MDKWFNSKWFVRVVSLAFAILLYVFVNIEATSTQPDDEPRVPSGSNEVQTLNDVPVDIQTDEEDVVVKGVPEFVTVTLEGPNGILIPTVRQRNFDIFVDLYELEEGDHTVEIEHAKIPNELKVFIEPKEIDITIEERASEEFSVLVDYINLDELPDGYEIGEVEVDPETITVTSSRSMIDQVAMVKIFIDVDDITEPINNREVPINVYDSQGNGLDVRVDPERVVVSVDVDNPSKTVSVQVETTNELPEGYELISLTADPEEIEVFAPTDTLSDLDELFTEEIDLSTITSSETIEANIVTPDGATVNGETVEIDIETELSKDFEEVPISVNEAAEQDVQFLTSDEPVVLITATGSAEYVSDLTEEDIEVFIDVEDLPEGEHKVPVSIEGPEDVNFEIDDEEVTINIM